MQAIQTEHDALSPLLHTKAKLTYSACILQETRLAETLGNFLRRKKVTKARLISKLELKSSYVPS